MRIQRFEDIDAWKKARLVTNTICQLGRSRLSCDRSLQDQIQRASVSVMANIGEGFDCKTKMQFAQFLVYAIRSASEVQSHLYVALDQGFISEDEFHEVYDDVTNVKNLVGGFIRYLTRSGITNGSTEAPQHCSTAAPQHCSTLKGSIDKFRGIN